MQKVNRVSDVYNIRPETFDVYVQLSPVNSIEIKLLHLNSLYTSLLNDHDLASVSPLLRAKVIQTLFICSGCDYISFFCWDWKNIYDENFL